MTEKFERKEPEHLRRAKYGEDDPTWPDLVAECAWVCVAGLVLWIFLEGMK